MAFRGVLHFLGMSRKHWTDDKIFDRLLNNRSDNTYWDNIAELRTRPNRNIFHKAVELTESENPKYRLTGIDILAQLGIRPRPFYVESLNLFFNILEKEKEPKVLISLLFAIGHNNDNLDCNYISQLCSFSDTTDTAVKYALVNSLLGIDNENAIATLIQFSKDTSSNIRNWSTFGLGTQIENDTPPIREALWDRISDKNKDTKFEAISGLAIRKDERLIPIIQTELLKEDYPGLLFEAIINFGDKQFLPILQMQYTKYKSDSNINPGWLEDMENCIAELGK